MTDFVRLEGYALHAGVATAVTLVKRVGPLAFEQRGRQALLRDLAVQRSDGGVTVSDGQGLEIDLVEHLLAALGGIGIRQDVTVVVEGPEVPILDGGARLFAEALLCLDLPRGTPDLFVARTGELTEGLSSYRFDLSESTELFVETSFASLGTERAHWDGSARAFLSDIASARTFGFRSEQDAYFRRGRALLAKRTDDPRAIRTFSEAVLVFDDGGHDVAEHVVPRRTAEVSRHKLLDLIGDFALYGGPPCGKVTTTNPGHTASHRIIREALTLGLLSRR